MEHKPSTASFVRRPIRTWEEYHWCGNCKHFTESYEEPEGVFHWGEHCYAGQSHDVIRHCPFVECNKWEAKQYD